MVDEARRRLVVTRVEHARRIGLEAVEDHLNLGLEAAPRWRGRRGGYAGEAEHVVALRRIEPERSGDGFEDVGQEGAHDEILTALIELAPDRVPLDAVRGALSRVMTRFETADFIAIDDLMRSSEALRARKQAGYERQERALFAGVV